MNIRTIDHTKKRGIDETKLSIDQQRRLQLKAIKDMLLIVADKSATSDAEVQRLMTTGFASSIGPYMRAMFPPAVATALHLPLHTADHTAMLSPEEESAVAAAATAHAAAPQTEDCDSAFWKRGLEDDE